MSEVALFENALRAAVPAKPDPMASVALMPRLAATARAATLETATVEVKAHTNGRPAASPARPRRRLALVARVAVAIALIPLVLAGLAFAGVHLPQPARDVFDSVGIDLPNQPSGDSKQGTDGKSGGGNDVSGAAKSDHGTKGGNSAAAHRNARDQRSKSHGKALGHDQGKAIGLNEGTPPGQAKEPPGQSQEPAGQDNGASGQEKTPPGQEKTPPGQGKAEASEDNSNAGGSSEDHAIQGVGRDNPFRPQANGKALGQLD